MSSEKTLILFTGSYPYEAAVEHTFLDPEMAYLHRAFERVIIVPGLLEGKRRQLPEGVMVEEEYARCWQAYFKPLRVLPKVLVSDLFWKGVREHPEAILNPGVIKKMMWITASAEFTRNWVSGYIAQNAISLQHTVFYTYWLDHITLGIGLAKDKYPALRLCSRAHNYDIYEDRRIPPYIPFRTICLKRLNHLFSISDDGKEFLTRRYPWAAPRISVARLGVRDPGFISSRSIDDVKRIVSCSMLVPFKRVNLLLTSLQKLAADYPYQRFEWTHLGDGPMKDELLSMVRLSPENLKCSIKGFLPNDQVLAYYRDNPVDVFINVSEIEGIPVAIMEAQSCGIPVIVTATGGSPEIVSNENGRLLEKNPQPEAVASAVWELIKNENQLEEKKKLSKQNWMTRYNSASNFLAFTEALHTI